MDELPPLVKWAQDSPPLPDPYGWFDIRGEAADGFTADQMRAYAAAAVAMERERLLSVAIARADHEAKAAAHHTGTWYEAHAHHLAAHKAMCDLVDAVWPDRAAAIRGA